MVAVWAVARAVPGLSFSSPFEPEALARRMWLAGGEMRAAQCMAWAGGASEQRLAARARGRKRRTSAATAGLSTCSSGRACATRLVKLSEMIA